jgi:hypothetical protein
MNPEIVVLLWALLYNYGTTAFPSVIFETKGISLTQRSERHQIKRIKENRLKGTF